MKVSHYAFPQVCKRLADAGMQEATAENGFLALWCALDRNRSGWLTLHEWNETAFQVLSVFTGWATQEFGRVTSCIKALTDKAIGGVNREAFERGISTLGLSLSDMDLLFEGLSLVPIHRAPKPRKSMEKRKSLAVSQSPPRPKKNVKAGVITEAKVRFLDHWNYEQQYREEPAWYSITKDKLGC